MQISRIDDFSCPWGESLCWDDLRQRLYFVDCSKQELYWLENGELPLNSLKLSSMPTGLLLGDDGRLVIALDQGFDIIDADTEQHQTYCKYPQDIGKRANDATVDSAGNIITGSLNLGPAPGSYWRYNQRQGWTQLDDDVSNTNGPVVTSIAGNNSLVIADTPAQKLYIYDYDENMGCNGPRRIFADTAELNAVPDGACADTQGGIWSCLLGNGSVARYTDNGLHSQIPMGASNPSDICFGGKNLDRMFVTSISFDLGNNTPKTQNCGAMLVIDDSGFSGTLENRIDLPGF